jgi:STE24 endopeptidase
MQRRTALTNLADLDPGPVPYLLFASHPTTVQRIAAAAAFATEAALPMTPAPDRPRGPREASA